MRKYFSLFFLLSGILLAFISYPTAMEKDQGEKRSYEQAFDSPSSDEEGKKRPRIDSSEPQQGQIFGVRTFDTAFKYLFQDTEIRTSFIKLFAQIPNIESTQLLDSSMNPIQDSTVLRNLVNSQDTKLFIDKIGKNRDEKDIQVQLREPEGDWKTVIQGARFLHPLASVFEDLKKAFPTQERNSQLDVVCKMDNNEFALVEVQVKPQNYWDSRALAYAGAFYGNQLKKGGDWQHLKKVIAINLLGGGPDGLRHWKDSPNEFVRHYMMQDQTPGQDHTIDMLQIIQYNIMYPDIHKIDNNELKDWMLFWQQAHKMTDEKLKTVQTEIVKAAYDRIRIQTMPENIRKNYIQDANEYANYSHYISQEKEEARLQGEQHKAQDIALKMLAKGMSEADIMDCTGLTAEQIRDLKNEGDEQ